MGVLAKFVIVDYDGQRYDFYRFGDGEPEQFNDIANIR